MRPTALGGSFRRPTIIGTVRSVENGLPSPIREPAG
jgi:hypothetical protein